MSTTYAIKQKDYQGAEYVIGYTIARTQKEATQRAQDVHVEAYAVPVAGDAVTDAMDDIVASANDRTVKGSAK